MKIRSLILLLPVLASLMACHHAAVLPEPSAQVATAIASNTVVTVVTEQVKEIPFVKRSFSPYIGEKWIGNAISYGAYRKGQAPGVKGPSEADILEDLNILKEHWNLIRVYGSDADSERVLKVIHENKLPFKVMLGIWLENETKNLGREVENLEQAHKAIELANRYKNVVLAVNAGNESQVFWSWHRMEAVNLIKYIRTVRANIQQPVTTADDFGFWNKPESHLVADELDFIALHAYPLWNGQKLDHAMVWADSVYQDIRSKHPDMTIVLSEIGWATVYNPEKMGPGEQGSLIKAEVSLRAQEIFLNELNQWTNKNQITTFLFEAFDEPWKGGGDQSGPNEVEKHWGVYNEDRTPKKSLINYLNK